MKKKQTNNLHIEPPPPPPGFFDKIHFNIMNLNNSKFFAGVVMIMLNVGSKFIPIQFSKSAEEYLKQSLSKAMLVFAMSWMGTRDIYTAIVLTIIFVIMSDYLFNEESMFCIVPHEKRILESINTNTQTPSATSTQATTVSTTTTNQNTDISKQTLELIEKTRKKIDGDNK